MSDKGKAQVRDCKLKRGKVHARKEKSVRDRKAYKGEGKQETKEAKRTQCNLKLELGQE